MVVIYFYAYLLVSCFNIHVKAQSASIETSGVENYANINFEIADLARTVSDGYETIHLEAFKSSENDGLFQSKMDKSKLSRLLWVSLGDPKIVRSENVENKNLELFHFTPEGFYTNVEMLTKAQQQFLAETATSKYNVDIRPNQIVHLVLSKFECSLIFYVDGIKKIIYGNVTDFRQFPLRLDFLVPLGSEERLYLTQNSYVSSTDFSWICNLASRGKELKLNTLTVSVEQINRMNLAERIFGPASSTRVTRTQMNNLAVEMYTSLNIVEDYDLPLFQFKTEFVEGIIKQAGATAFAPLSFDQAIAELSKYSTDISGDLKPDVIKSDYGKIFKLDKYNGSSYIKLNDEVFDTKSQGLTVGVDISTTVGIKGVSIGGSIGACWDNQKEWTNGKKSLSEQLKQINTENQNDIQWAIEGEKIIPKSLNVARMNKASFTRTYDFSRIRRSYYDAPFRRAIVLETITYSPAENIGSFPIGSIISISQAEQLKSFDTNGKGFNAYSGWYLCDGRNGSPDLRERFLVGYNSAVEDYNKVGKIGGSNKIRLALKELPSHVHADNGHKHQINIDSSNTGAHTHGYWDVYHSEAPSISNSYVSVTRQLGSRNRLDNDNVGHQFSRQTSNAGLHSHSINGATAYTSAQSIKKVGGDKEHENRPPYFVTAFIIRLN